MLETRALQSQDGACGSPDGEGLAPASNEISQTHQRRQQQLVAACARMTLAAGGQQRAWRGGAIEKPNWKTLRGGWCVCYNGRLRM